MWKYVNSFILQYPHLAATDQAIFAREYMPGQGYQAGQTNQLINNFKKDVSKRNTNQWYYRNQAVALFAQEFNSIINPSKPESVFVTCIPSSRTKADTLYDNRFEDMFGVLKNLSNRVVDIWPVSIQQSVQASHLGGSRNPATIMTNYQWHGFGEVEPEKLFVFDDIVTTGSHFRAFSDFCRSNNFNGEIIGVFWARCI